jgi:hypothetical protein
LIDNIFIDNIRDYTIKPCINGLPDHDAQLITLKNFPLPISNTEPKVILIAKKLHYNKCILSSRNKMKSTWEIINEERGKSRKGIDIQSLIIDNNEIMNQKQITNIFNNYFLTMADTITSNNNNHRNANMTRPNNYSANGFRKPFENIHWQYTSTYEITKLVKSLKTKNSRGYDEISNCIIKLSAILRTGIFPDTLKYAIVNQTLKKEIGKKSPFTDQYLY